MERQGPHALLTPRGVTWLGLAANSALSAAKMRIKRAREEFRERYEELTGAEPAPPHARSAPDRGEQE